MQTAELARWWHEAQQHARPHHGAKAVLDYMRENSEADLDELRELLTDNGVEPQMQLGILANMVDSGYLREGEGDTYHLGEKAAEEPVQMGLDAQGLWHGPTPPSEGWVNVGEGPHHGKIWREQQKPQAPAQQSSPQAAKAAQEYKTLGTKAPAFKSWFGDWEKNPATASKVVDNAGSPEKTHKIKAVFHGTTKDFESFDRNAKVKNAADAGPGIYFAEDQRIANNFSDGTGKVLTVYLNIRNPFDFGATVQPQQIQQITAAATALGIAPKTPLAAMNEPTRGDKAWNALADVYGDKDINKILGKAGYDGIVHYAGDVDGSVNPKSSEWGRVWVAFDPKQIKSVDNLGTFNPEDDRLRMSAQPEQQSPLRLARKDDDSGPSLFDTPSGDQARETETHDGKKPGEFAPKGEGETGKKPAHKERANAIQSKKEELKAQLRAMKHEGFEGVKADAVKAKEAAGGFTEKLNDHVDNITWMNEQDQEPDEPDDPNETEDEPDEEQLKKYEQDMAAYEAAHAKWEAYPDEAADLHAELEGLTRTLPGGPDDEDLTPAEHFERLGEIIDKAKEMETVDWEPSGLMTPEESGDIKEHLAGLIKDAKQAREHLRQYSKHRKEMDAIRRNERLSLQSLLEDEPTAPQQLSLEPLPVDELRERVRRLARKKYPPIVQMSDQPRESESHDGKRPGEFAPNGVESETAGSVESPEKEKPEMSISKQHLISPDELSPTEEGHEQGRIDAMSDAYPKTDEMLPVVYFQNGGKNEIIDGHHRWRVADKRGQKLPAVGVTEEEVDHLKEEGIDHNFAIAHAALMLAGEADAASEMENTAAGLWLDQKDEAYYLLKDFRKSNRKPE